jgi:choline/glycine/proline betaine transport protein
LCFWRIILVLFLTLAIVLIAGFFITPSDSGSLVVDNLTSEAPVGQRIFGQLLKVVLLGSLIGGTVSLQTATIVTDTFAVI